MLIIVVSAPPQELHLSVTYADEEGVAVECFVGEVYPQPSARMVLVTQAGVVKDLGKWTNSSTVWQDGKFDQRNEIYLKTSEVYRDHDSDAPVLHENDEVKCEVSLQGTEYREVLYRRLEFDGKNNSKSLQSSSFLITILLMIFL